MVSCSQVAQVTCLATEEEVQPSTVELEELKETVMEPMPELPAPETVMSMDVCESGEYNIQRIAVEDGKLLYIL